MATLLERDDIQVNLQNNEGETALMIACRNRKDLAAIKLLARDDIEMNLQINLQGSSWAYRDSQHLCMHVNKEMKISSSFFWEERK